MHEAPHVYAWEGIPFVLLLLAIAVLPLLRRTEHWWEHLSSKLTVALVISLPVAAWTTYKWGAFDAIHSYVEFVQFIVPLLALFYISTGISITANFRAMPEVNIAFLAIGALIASAIGTTGASMLLIYPLLNTNKERAHVAHTVVFFILIVANCGGLLLPTGDPPLLLGYLLEGVPFFWTTKLTPQHLFVNGFLLLSYYGVDCKKYAEETKERLRQDVDSIQGLRIIGLRNVLWLGGVILSILYLPSIDMHKLHETHFHEGNIVPVRELAMLGLIGVAHLCRVQKAYEDNSFSWHPIGEVAALFVGIFPAMGPALRFLEQTAPSLPLNELTFFVYPGMLSACLDNAPTYLAFFRIAEVKGGSPAVAGVYEPYLAAISMGAVFCGALTYIGNGPNFMVKAIAESQNIKMPSFFAYVVYAGAMLVPILVAMAAFFIAATAVAYMIGMVICAIISARALFLVVRYRHSPVAGLLSEQAPALEATEI